MGSPAPNDDLLEQLTGLLAASSGGFNNSILAGAGTLIRTMIRSPNYVTGVSGWTINKDGSAEFNNLTVRGTFAGTNFVINSNGAFFYSPTEAFGNLVASLTVGTGNDSFGNAYLNGFTSYSNLGAIFVANSVDTTNQFSFWTAPAANGPWTSVGSLQADVNGNVVMSANNLFGTAAPLDAVISGVFETYHNFTLVGGTSGGVDINGTSYPPAYKLLPTGDVAIRGVLITGGAGLAAGTTWATIPAGYRPVTNVPVALVSNKTVGTFTHVYVRPNGNMQFLDALGATVTMYIDSILLVRRT